MLTADSGLKEKIRKVMRDPELMAGVCYTGIAEMFKTSWFPILPRILIEKGVAPNEWFGATQQSSPGLSLSLIECCFGVSPVRTIKRLKSMGLPYEKVGAISKYFSKIIDWEGLLESLSEHSETIRDLGLLWYLSIILSSGEEVLEMARELGILVDEIDARVRQVEKLLNEKTSLRVGKER